MKAMLMTAVGAPEVLQLHTLNTPLASAPNALLVRLKAAGLNPIDTKLRGNGTYYPDRMPTILGCDGAGIVEAVGSAVTHFHPGDAVYFCHGGIGDLPGTYAEYAVVDEYCIAAKPQRLSFAEAAAVPLALITAWESLHDRWQAVSGARVLIHAGAGGVGHLAIQLARLAGCEVATTVSSEEKATLVRHLGASLAIDYKHTDFVQATRDWSDDHGVDMVFDTVGGATFAQSFGALGLYGDIVTLIQPDATVDWKTARLRNLRISLELMLSPLYYADEAALARQANILAQAAPLFDNGQLHIELAGTYPLAEAVAAHRHLERGGFAGKLALLIDD